MNHHDFFRLNRRSGKCLAFHKGNSSTQSNPTTQSSVTDNRVAGSEGSVVAGSGATIIKNDVSAEAIKSSNDAIMSIANHATSATLEAAKSATGVASDAIMGNVNATQAALNSNTDVSSKALDTTGTALRDVLDFGGNAIQQLTQGNQASLDLIGSTNKAFTEKLSANAGEAPTALADNTVKYLTIAAAVVTIAVFFKPSKT